MYGFNHEQKENIFDYIEFFGRFFLYSNIKYIGTSTLARVSSSLKNVSSQTTTNGAARLRLITAPLSFEKLQIRPRPSAEGNPSHKFRGPRSKHRK